MKTKKNKISLSLKVGITGGIGSGKTTVCRIFELLGIPVYYADDRAKALYTESNSVREAVVSLMGEEAYLDDQLNRSYLSNKIFEDPSLRNALNAIIHPAVHTDLSQWFSQQKTPYALEEAALILESGGYKFLDFVILVSAPESTRIARVSQRDNHNIHKIENIIESQSTDQAKRKICHFEIINDGHHSLIDQVMYIDSILKDKLT